MVYVSKLVALVSVALSAKRPGQHITLILWYKQLQDMRITYLSVYVNMSVLLMEFRAASYS